MNYQITPKAPPRTGRALIAAFAFVSSLTTVAVISPPPKESATSTPEAIAHKTCADITGVIAQLPHDPLHLPPLTPTIDKDNGSPACAVGIPGKDPVIVDAGMPEADIRAKLAKHNPPALQPVN